MGKTIKFENYRVVIYPRTRIFGIPCGDEKELCDDIRIEIKRHVDNVGSVNVECDNVPACEYCGAEWTEVSDTFNGGCCQKDMESEPPGLANP